MPIVFFLLEGSCLLFCMLSFVELNFEAAAKGSLTKNLGGAERGKPWSLRPGARVQTSWVYLRQSLLR